MRSRALRWDGIALCAVSLAFTLILAPAARAVAPAPLIVIDPGHGGRYSNANANRLREKNANLLVALELRRQLRARGYRVLMTRATDRAVRLYDIPTWNYNERTERWSLASDHRTGYTSGIPKDDLQARVDYANRVGADLFISVHANGSPNRSARGYETISSRRDWLGVSLASVVQPSVISRTGLRNRGWYTKDLFVCRWANMPAVLVESAFVSNPRDAWLLKRYWFRRRLASGVAHGVDQWMKTQPYTALWPRISADEAVPLSSALATSSPQTSPVAAAVVVRADRPLDAPGAVAFAAQMHAPLIQVGSSITTTTRLALAALAPRKIIPIGVAGSFDETHTSQLASAAALPTASVEAIEARDRESLSAAIALRMTASSVREVLMVSAADTGSVLAATPAAALRGVPLMLVSPSGLSTATSAALNTLASRGSLNRAILVGPPGSVPAWLASGHCAITRVNSDDSAGIAARLLNRYLGFVPYGSLRPVVADSTHPAEYLAAAAYAANSGQPLLPVKGRVMPARTREWITNRRPQTIGFEIVDGRRTIPLLMDRMIQKADAE